MDWLDELATAMPPGCWRFRDVLRARLAATRTDAADAAAMADDALVALVFEICVLVVDDDPKKPLRPTSPHASRDVNALSEDELDQLKAVAERLPPDLRGRVRDVLWTRRRGRELAAAQALVADYCEAAEALALAGEVAWDRGCTRIRRALGVARAMNWQDGIDVVRTKALALMADERLRSHFRVEFADVASECGAEAARAAAETVVALADAELNATGQGRPVWDWIRKALEVASEARKRADDPQGAEGLRVRRAKTYLMEESTAAASGASAAIRAHILEGAVVAHRAVGAPREEVDAIHARMLEQQNAALAGFKEIASEKISMAEEAIQAMRRVSGKTFRDALETLALMAPPPVVSELREWASELLETFKAQSFISIAIVDDAGRKIGDRGAEPDEILKSKMHECARIHHSFTVVGTIAPARSKIAAEHPARLGDWVEFLSDRFLVGQDRIVAVATGLSAGLQGDPITSVSILVPQLENMIRTMLESSGVITTKLDAADSTQQQIVLSSMLGHQTLLRILGENVVFDLKGLLDERIGPNLRNRVAHGLVSDRDFYTTDAVRLWFMVLHLVVLVRATSGAPEPS